MSDSRRVGGFSRVGVTQTGLMMLRRTAKVVNVSQHRIMQIHIGSLTPMICGRLDLTIIECATSSSSRKLAAQRSQVFVYPSELSIRGDAT